MRHTEPLQNYSLSSSHVKTHQTPSTFLNPIVPQRNVPKKKSLEIYSQLSPSVITSILLRITLIATYPNLKMKVPTLTPLNSLSFTQKYQHLINRNTHTTYHYIHNKREGRVFHNSNNNSVYISE